MRKFLLVILFFFLCAFSTNITNLNLSGEKLFANKDYFSALAKFEEAYKINPNDLRTLGNLAITRIKIKQPWAAKEVCKQMILIASDPKELGKIYYNLGYAEECMGSFDEAVNNYTKSINFRTNKTVSSKIDNINKQKNNKWFGKWNRNCVNSEGTLIIKKITSSNFEFSINAMSGAHIGNVEGLAKINDNYAYSEIKTEFDNEEPCKIKFTNHQSYISIVATNCDMWAGAGVCFDGEYSNKTLTEIENIVEKYATIFENDKTINLIKEITGDKFIYISSTIHLTNEIENLDKFQSSVYLTGVGGVFSLQQTIFQISKEGKIYIATVEGNEIYYFSNDNEYKKVLTKTIEKWKNDNHTGKKYFINS